MCPLVWEASLGLGFLRSICRMSLSQNEQHNATPISVSRCSRIGTLPDSSSSHLFPSLPQRPSDPSTWGERSSVPSRGKKHQGKAILSWHRRPALTGLLLSQGLCDFSLYHRYHWTIISITTPRLLRSFEDLLRHMLLQRTDAPWTRKWMYRRSSIGTSPHSIWTLLASCKMHSTPIKACLKGLNPKSCCLICCTILRAFTEMQTHLLCLSTSVSRL